MKKLDLKKVTLFCLDGRPDEHERTMRYRRILNFMLSRVEFFDIKVFTTFNIEVSGIKNNIINPMGIHEYSNFCLGELNNHIESEFCLIFQDDGFILNPELWDDIFYNYDYIGAPWPRYIGWPEEGKQVGNGGFSLRSKRFLEESAKLPSTTSNEDTYLVCKNRSILESNGLKIAPLDVARKFAIEFPLDDQHNINSCFGFHAKSLLDSAVNYINNRK